MQLIVRLHIYHCIQYIYFILDTAVADKFCNGKS